MTRVSPKQAAFILRGLASSIVGRATANSDVAGQIITRLGDVANEIEETDALPNDDDLNAFLGPIDAGKGAR